jgi:hypothetical protein
MWHYTKLLFSALESLCDNNFSLNIQRSKNSVVAIVTILRARRFRLRIKAGAINFLFPKTVQIGSRVNPASYSMGNGFL